MYVRKRVVEGVTYYSVVEGFRQDGKVRQRTIVSLKRSPTVPEAIVATQKELARLRRQLARQEPLAGFSDRHARRVERLRTSIAEEVERLATLKRLAAIMDAVVEHARMKRRTRSRRPLEHQEQSAAPVTEDVPQQEGARTEAPQAPQRSKGGPAQLRRVVVAAIDTAHAAEGVTDDDIDELLANDLMLAGLRKVIGLADRIVRRHSGTVSSPDTTAPGTRSDSQAPAAPPGRVSKKSTRETVRAYESTLGMLGGIARGLDELKIPADYPTEKLADAVEVVEAALRALQRFHKRCKRVVGA